MISLVVLSIASQIYTFIVLEKTNDHISSHSMANLPFDFSETFI